MLKNIFNFSYSSFHLLGNIVLFAMRQRGGLNELPESGNIGGDDVVFSHIIVHGGQNQLGNIYKAYRTKS